MRVDSKDFSNVIVGSGGFLGSEDLILRITLSSITFNNFSNLIQYLEFGGILALLFSEAIKEFAEESDWGDITFSKS